jgi:hypothetical protein
MAIMELPVSERIVGALRPVARWVPQAGADGRTRLVMIWSVPDPQPADLHTAVA